MADQKQKRTSDFSVQGPSARRPVSEGTLMEVAGEQMMQGGLGTMFSAAQRGGQAAATRATFQKIGEENAQNIRNRFYQKEMEQVKKMRIDPILERIKLAEREYQLKSSVKVRTIGKIEGYDAESIAKNAQLQAATAPPAPPQEVKSGSGETAKTEIMPGTPTPAPSQILTGDVMGGQSVTEGLSVLDPMDPTGQRAINATTAEGQSILDRHTADFWQIYSDANMELMDIFAEYAGNPFMDNAMRGLAEETMNQAGFGVTGQKTPDEQVAFRRQVEDDDQARLLKREELATARKRNADFDTKARKTEGMTQAAGRRSFGLGVGSKDNTDEQNEAEYKLEIAERTAKLKAEKNDGLFRFPKAVIANPGSRTLASEVRDEPKYKAYVKEELAGPIKDLMNEHANDPQAWAKRYTGILGDQGTQAAGAEAPGSTAMAYYAQQVAMAGSNGGTARANSLTRRLEEISTWQDPLKNKIDNELAVLRARGQSDGTWSDEDELVYKANPVALYVGKTDPSADVTYWSPAAKNRYRDAVGEKAANERFMNDEAPGSTPAGAALQPTQEELDAFHNRPKGTISEKVAVRAKMTPKQKREALPAEPLAVKAGESVFDVDITKMNKDQLKELNERLLRISTGAVRTEPGVREKAARLRKEVRALYTTPLEREVARVEQNFQNLGTIIGDAISSLSDAEKVRAKDLLTVPEATGGSTIGSAKSAAGK